MSESTIATSLKENHKETNEEQNIKAKLGGDNSKSKHKDHQEGKDHTPKQNSDAELANHQENHQDTSTANGDINSKPNAEKKLEHFSSWNKAVKRKNSKDETSKDTVSWPTLEQAAKTLDQSPKGENKKNNANSAKDSAPNADPKKKGVNWIPFPDIAPAPAPPQKHSERSERGRGRPSSQSSTRSGAPAKRGASGERRRGERPISTRERNEPSQNREERDSTRENKREPRDNGKDNGNLRSSNGKDGKYRHPNYNRHPRDYPREGQAQGQPQGQQGQGPQGQEGQQGDQATQNQGQPSNRQNWRSNNRNYYNNRRGPRNTRPGYGYGYGYGYPVVLEGEALNAAVLQQVEYYFSIENLCKDLWLRQQMDDEGWLPLSLIGNFNRVRALCSDPRQLLDIVKASNEVELDATAAGNEKVRRKKDWKQWVLPKANQTEEQAKTIQDKEKEAAELQSTGNVQNSQ